MSNVRLALLLVLSLVTVCAQAARQPRERGSEAALANTNLGAGYLQQGRRDHAGGRRPPAGSSPARGSAATDTAPAPARS